MKNAQKILKSIPGKKILVIGDVILDTYVWGKAERISPEAPVPIVKVSRENTQLGGAANVARNLKAVGCTPLLLGVIGQDQAGRELKDRLEAEGISGGRLLVDPGRQTSVKTRILAQKQQLVRIDREEVRTLGKKLEQELLRRIAALAKEASAVIISDYGKGVISQSLMERLVPRLRSLGVPVCVDPKEKNFRFYREVTVVTPNLAEASFGSGIPITGPDSLLQAAQALVRTLRLENCLITQGEGGMTLVDRLNEVFHIDAWQKEEVFDVTGAGDTVISVLAAALAAGATMKDAAQVANCAAGFVVKVVGCGVVTLAELGKAL